MRGDIGRHFDFGAGVLDGADQAGRRLGGFAHRDRRLLGGGSDFAGLAEHSAGRACCRARAIGQDLGLVGACTNQLGDLALELLALLVARVRRFDRLEKRHLGKNDVGFERGQPAEGGDAALERVELFRIAVKQAGEDLRFQLVAGSNVGRDRGALGVDAAAIFGDGLDPARIDLAGIMRLDLGGGVRSELRAHFRLDDVAGFLPKLADIPFQRSARIVSGEPVAHLLVGEPLQLSMIPTHRSPFRKPVSRRSALRPDLLLPHIG